MYTTHVDPHGVELVYRSSRQGFTHYLMGKIFQSFEQSFSPLKKEMKNKIFRTLRSTMEYHKININLPD